MLDSQKQENLESVVLGGFCPECRSTALAYSEIERERIFKFKCNKCGWKVIYTSDEFKEASASWAKSRGTLNGYF